MLRLSLRNVDRYGNTNHSGVQGDTFVSPCCIYQNEIADQEGKFSYDAYGNTISKTGDIQIDFLYNGKYGVITDGRTLNKSNKTLYNLVRDGISKGNDGE